VILRKIFTAAFSLLLWTNLIHAQINRPYEPIVLTGDTLSQFSNYEISRLYAYTYDATTDTWRRIPFQIDEVDSSAKEEEEYFKPEPDSLSGGILDFDDEIVFMARDLRDKAPTNRWIEHTDSIRYELEFIDPIDESKSYLYLYYSNTTTEPSPTTTYFMRYEDAVDRIITETYEIGFNETGQLSDIMIRNEAGGSGEDIFDRIKVRLYGLITFIFPFPVPINENSIIADSAYAKVGPVRIIRNLNAHFYYDLGILDPFNEPFVQTSFFYPWSSSFSITGIPIDDLQDYADLLYTRLSWDMNRNATGMYFYCESNRNGVLVDGSGKKEGINFKSQNNDFDWTMISGSQGTLVNIFYVPALGDSQGIFYYDNNDDSLMTNGDPENFQSFLVDTGDSVAYGDSGYFLYNDIVGEEFNFIYHNYFLPPDINPEIASQLCNQTRQPLQCITQTQQYVPLTNVSENESYPKYKFELHQNYPNPFNSSTVISFSLAEPGNVSLIIYDLLGKQIKKIVYERLSDGIHKYTWAGDNDQGNSVPTGLYFYKLKVDNRVATKKVVLVK